MRWRTIVLGGLLAGTLAGCSDLSDNPLSTLTRSGRDARYFNPQTGHYEWPEEEAPRKRPRTAAIDEAVSESSPRTPSKPITPGAGDDRVFNPMKQQFESPQ
jgi:hypothetical protein